MKFIFKHIYWIFLVTTLPLSAVLQVKVLLATCDPGQELTFSSKQGFTLQNPDNQRPLKLQAGREIFQCLCKEDGIYLDGKKLFKESMIFAPHNKIIAFDGETYHGLFLIKKVDNRYLVINIVPLEDYVLSVLKTESWPGWPLEMNKVMAIIVRTYCLHHVIRAHQKKAPYHLRNSIHHQTYRGIHSCAVSKKAVDDTKGIFIAHKNIPILAMFDCCCGGIVPAEIEGVIDFNKAPYLARPYACQYCQSTKMYQWSITYSLEEFMNLLQELMPFIVKNLKDVKTILYDKAGLVKKVMIKTKHGHFSLTGEQLYRLSPKIKSYACKVTTKRNKKIVITGRGFGHHMGLCQWGAREMVRAEYPFHEIINFYYPGTGLMCFIEEGSNKKRTNIKGILCQDIKGILSEAQLRSLA